MDRASDTESGEAQGGGGSGGDRTVYTIPPGMPFADALAAGMLARASDDPLELAGALILLPTRRAGRALRDAFLRQSGGRALLLPRMQPIGDIDEDEMLFAVGDAPNAAAALTPAITDLRRQLLLARLVMRRGDPPTSADQAAWLAAELARLLDQVQTERLSFDALAGLVSGDYAEHWRKTLDFLQIVTEWWPDILADEGALDPADRRDRLIAAQAETWRRDPPTYQVVAAGSTGSIPATADLLEVVAGLPAGAVLLPGLDRASDGRTWEAIRSAPTHPQFGIAKLLDRLGVDRRDVRDWPVPDDSNLPAAPPARASLVAEIMRPAETTDAWREIAIDPDGVGAALADVARVDCPTPREEAGAIALIMREALQTEGRTAALVTPDRGLARRVAAELRRWRIEIDDSAGVPLAATPPGAFLRLIAAMVAADMAPVPLLAALKHPLAAGGMERAKFRDRARALERAVLRGVRPARGLAGLRSALEADGRARDLVAWIDDVAARLAPLADLAAPRRTPLDTLLDAHIRVAEALAASEGEDGAARLWAGEAGEAAARFFSDARRAARGFDEISLRDYSSMLDALMAGQMVRPRFGRHPRLNIWGPLEARLQHADVMILGGLNEGTWPLEPAADPWMSRPMRKNFGLPEQERRVGLAAHDFAQTFCAPRVVLTRAARVEGVPTVPSRWLLRLETVLAGLGHDGGKDRDGATWARGPWLSWQHMLDKPTSVKPVARPAPRPPLAARPRSLSVTRIETWTQDPYGIYARYVLRLAPLDPIDAPPGPSERGIFVHHALQRFVAEAPAGPPGNALARLIKIGKEEFEAVGDRTGIWAFWWPRFERIAEWVVAHEAKRRPEIAASVAETQGAMEINVPGGTFTIKARADRVDRRADGTLEIIDYKTGAPPSRKRVEAGFAPQLPLEAAIARAGKFAGVDAAPVSRLTYWRLNGADPAGREMPVGDGEALADAALDNMRELVARYDDPAMPYAAVPRPSNAPRFNDYAHLARIKEWSAVGGGDDE